MQGAMTLTWHELRVEAPQEFLDAITNFLFELGAAGVQEEPALSGTALVAYFRHGDVLPALRSYLHSLGVAAAARLSTRLLPEEDWSVTWRQSFSPLAIGQRLWVHPPWLPSVPPGKVGICIEPGMAFGTGQHASTVGCLALLEQVVGETTVQRALDLGTGSGILAIALAKLGVSAVTAADTDPTARHVAAANARYNGVERQVRIVEEWRGLGPYDLIVANLFADLLCSFAADFAANLPLGGTAICSGYIESDRERVERCFEQVALVPSRTWQRDEWVTQQFTRCR